MKAVFDKLTDMVLSLFGFSMSPFEDLHGGLFSEITGRIYLGARPDKNAVKELKKTGITNVVSCLNEEERSSVDYLTRNFEHLFLPVHDGMHEDIAATFPAFFDFTLNLTRPDSDSKLFVHCGAGVSRSAALVIALLMKLETRRFLDVYQTVRLKRGQVLPNIGFASQLQQLENELLKGKHNAPPSSLAIYLREICNLPAEIDHIQSVLEQMNFDAVAATKAIFGNEIPRVMQGVKL